MILLYVANNGVIEVEKSGKFARLALRKNHYKDGGRYLLPSEAPKYFEPVDESPEVELVEDLQAALPPIEKAPTKKPATKKPARKKAAPKAKTTTTANKANSKQ